jgi:hypothetical protein
MPTRLLVAAVAVAGFMAHAPRASADYILDTFDSPNPGDYYQISLVNGVGPYTSPTTAVSAGVTRAVRVSVSTTPVNKNSVSGTIGGGTFTMDTDNSSAAASQITYALTGAAGDLSGATGVSLTFARLDAGLTATGYATDIPAAIQVVTATGTLTLNTAALPASAAAFTRGFDFGAFTGTGDLSRVSSITFTLNARLNGSGGLDTTSSRAAVDFALDGVSVTKPAPAPPGLVLAGVGGLALLGRARLARKRPAAI